MAIQIKRDRKLTRLFRRLLRGVYRFAGEGGWRGETGSSLVEMAIASSIILVFLLGIMQMGLALYAYHFTADAAREGSRWAMVRGNQCNTNTPGLDHCNASGSDIQSFVQGLGYPFASALSVTATWLSAGTTPAMTWSACGTTTACKAPGNQVQVTVSYNMPVYIPFWRNASIRVGSISQMVIAQ